MRPAVVAGADVTNLLSLAVQSRSKYSTTPTSPSDAANESVAVAVERHLQTRADKMDFITKMSKQSQDNIQALLKVAILATIAGAAISSRLFSVIRYLYLFSNL